jgi:hypothetical protein
VTILERLCPRRAGRLAAVRGVQMAAAAADESRVRVVAAVVAAVTVADVVSCTQTVKA